LREKNNFMNKPYLLIAGEDHYPCSGTGDWKGRFESYGEAESQVVMLEGEYLLYNYSVMGEKCDWYEIVDLRTWGVN
jgi:hypothetical protein